MAKLTAKYCIDDKDQFIIAKTRIKIETYLILTFISDLYDADVKFAALVEIKDFRIEKWDDKEWMIWLIDQDPIECQEIIEKLLERESEFSSTDWICSMSPEEFKTNA